MAIGVIAGLDEIDAKCIEEIAEHFGFGILFQTSDLQAQLRLRRRGIVDREQQARRLKIFAHTRRRSFKRDSFACRQFRYYANRIVTPSRA